MYPSADTCLSADPGDAPYPTEIDREIMSTVIDLALFEKAHCHTCFDLHVHIIDVYKIGQEAFIKRVLRQTHIHLQKTMQTDTQTHTHTGQ